MTVFNDEAEAANATSSPPRDDHGGWPTSDALLHGRPSTAGNSAGPTDGATAALLASGRAVEELGSSRACAFAVGFAFAGVGLSSWGFGPVPATERVRAAEQTKIDDVGLLNEPFAVQVLTWREGMGVSPDDELPGPVRAW